MHNPITKFVGTTATLAALTLTSQSFAFTTCRETGAQAGVPWPAGSWAGWQYEYNVVHRIDASTAFWQIALPIDQVSVTYTVSANFGGVPCGSTIGNPDTGGDAIALRYGGDWYAETGYLYENFAWCLPLGYPIKYVWGAIAVPASGTLMVSFNVPYNRAVYNVNWCY